jgi:hypothetical protein
MKCTARISNRLCLVFILMGWFSYSQNDSIPLQSLRNQYNHKRLKVYGFYDVVRQAGAGVEIWPGVQLGIDLRLGFIHPFNLGNLGNNKIDYFNSSGFTLYAIPKYFINKKAILFVSPWLGYEYFGYRKKWGRPGVGLDDDLIEAKELKDRITFGSVYGMGLGICKDYPKYFWELFLLAGMTFQNTWVKVYEERYPYLYPNVLQYPRTEYYRHYGYNVSAGIKIGLRSWKMPFPNKSYHKYVYRYFASRVKYKYEDVYSAYRQNRISYEEYRKFKKMRKVKLKEAKWYCEQAHQFKEDEMLKVMNGFLYEMDRLSGSKKTE